MVGAGHKAGQCQEVIHARSHLVEALDRYGTARSDPQCSPRSQGTSNPRRRYGLDKGLIPSPRSVTWRSPDCIKIRIQVIEFPAAAVSRSLSALSPAKGHPARRGPILLPQVYTRAYAVIGALWELKGVGVGGRPIGGHHVPDLFVVVAPYVYIIFSANYFIKI